MFQSCVMSVKINLCIKQGEDKSIVKIVVKKECMKKENAIIMDGILLANKSISIYALLDPRTNDVMYIGKAVNPSQRLYMHLYSSGYKKSYKYEWMRELKNEGYIPALQILEVVSSDKWQEREKYWISYYRDLPDSKLLNICKGGEGASSFYGRKYLGSKYKELNGYIGITHRRGKYYAQANIYGHHDGLGEFDNQYDAQVCFDTYTRYFYGDNLVYNFDKEEVEKANVKIDFRRINCLKDSDIYCDITFGMPAFEFFTKYSEGLIVPDRDASEAYDYIKNILESIKDSLR